MAREQNIDVSLGQSNSEPENVHSSGGARATKSHDAGSQTFAAILVGPSGLFREGLARVIKARGFEVVGSASRVEGLDQSPVKHDQPLLLIIDADGDAVTAIEEVERVKQQHSDARIAVMTDSEEIRDIAPLLRAGAHACFSKGSTTDAFSNPSN